VGLNNLERGGGALRNKTAEGRCSRRGLCLTKRDMVQSGRRVAMLHGTVGL